MANTIKQKRGTGSNPDANDLEVGEIAVRTDNGHLFTKNDSGTVIEHADIGVLTANTLVGRRLSNGNPQELTAAQVRTIINVADGATNVSNTNQLTNGAGYLTSVGTSDIDDNAVSSAKLAQLAQNRILGRVDAGTGNVQFLTRSEAQTVLNVEDGATADQTAAEILTLLSDQNIATTGTLSSGNFTVSNTQPEIFLQDTDSNSDFKIQNVNGVFKVLDATNNNGRFTIASDGTATFTQNLNANSGLDVTGNVTTTGSITITSAAPNLIFTESDADPDFGFLLSAGQLKFQDITNTANILTLDSSKIQAVTNLDCLAGLDVTGNTTIAADSDIRFTNGDWTGNTTDPKLNAHGNKLYVVGGSAGIVFRENASDRWNIDGSGHFIPAADSTYDIGSDGTRVANGYFDALTAGTVKIGNQLIEKANVINAKLSADPDIDVDDGNVFFFAIGETANATPNITSTASNINTIMAPGDIMTVTVIAVSTGSGYYQDVTIDGNQPLIQRWLDDDEPTSASGNADFEVYTYTIVKTSNLAFIILANRSVFK